MRWDKSSRPKRLRRKHKRIIILVSLAGSIMLVAAVGLWESFTMEDGMGSIVEFAGSFLSEEEKRVVWEGMSDEGKAVILKHTK